MPGFVAAVNTSVTVTDGATELYYMSYIYGFLTGGAVYALLHRLFPARAVASFVQESPPARELRETAYGRWDVSLAETPQVLGAARTRGEKTPPQQYAESPEVMLYGDGLDASQGSASQSLKNRE